MVLCKLFAFENIFIVEKHLLSGPMVQQGTHEDIFKGKKSPNPSEDDETILQ